MKSEEKAGGTNYFVEVFQADDRLSQPQMAGQAAMIVVHTEDGKPPLMLALGEIVAMMHGQKMGGFTRHTGGPGVVGPASFEESSLVPRLVGQDSEDWGRVSKP